MINFELDDDQKLIRETVAAFAAEQIRPAARAADESGVIPPELVAKGHELGLVRGAIPEAYGGYGDARSAVTGAIVMEELAWGDLAIAVHLLAPRLLVTPLAQDQFVAATAALNEPRFDFDPAAMKTVARREGQDFVLSGVKCCVPLAQE